MASTAKEKDLAVEYAKKILSEISSCPTGLINQSFQLFLSRYLLTVFSLSSILMCA